MTDVRQDGSVSQATFEGLPIVAVMPECRDCKRLGKAVTSAIESMKANPNDIVTIGCGGRKLLGRCGLMQSLIPQDHHLLPNFDYPEAELPIESARAHGAIQFSSNQIIQIANR